MNNLVAKKSLGQNFLINEGVVARIVEAAEVGATDTILEVGPGTGNLTAALVAKAGKVIAIEKDTRAILPLREQFVDLPIHIVEADALKINPQDLGIKAGEYKIVANLPYYITSHFMRTVFQDWPRPTTMVLMVQKEVARRIVAKPPEMNLLALSVQSGELPTYADRGFVGYQNHTSHQTRVCRR